MFSYILIVGAGGFIGALFRGLIVIFFVNRLEMLSMYAVLFVNVAGSFLAGIFAGLPDRLQDEYIKLFFITGFLGALTTFSSFSLENLSFLKSGDYKYFAFNVLSNVILTTVFVSAGFYISKKIFS